MRLPLHLERQVDILTRKKVIFVIVEGPSDEDALGAVLQGVYGDSSVHVHVMHRDITTEKGINPSNIVKKIGDEIRLYAERMHFKSIHFREIIHIVDTDGAYISDENIIEDMEVSEHIYSPENIRTFNKQGIQLRNECKRENIDRLCTCKKIWNLPYRIFYMSCNLDHVLYNKLNSSDHEKEVDSLKFAKYYKDRIPNFLNFISNSNFSVMTDYKQSWNYIKEDLHSLERHTNFGLCFKETDLS